MESLRFLTNFSVIRNELLEHNIFATRFTKNQFIKNSAFSVIVMLYRYALEDMDLAKKIQENFLV